MKTIMSYFISQKKNIHKILFTLIIIFVYVIGTNIPVPCLDSKTYKAIKFWSSIRYQILNFGFGKDKTKFPFAILSLGVMPYITTSIILQLANKIVPFLKEWGGHGEKGKYKLNLFSRFITLILSFGYGLSITSQLKHNRLLSENTSLMQLKVTFFLVVGVFICIWLADLITAKGIGNGISILIAINISKEVYNTFNFLYAPPEDYALTIWSRCAILSYLLCLLVLTIILCSAYLKIPILYYTINVNTIHEAKIDKHIPFKISSAGVLPVILATSLMNMFDMISVFLSSNSNLKNIIDSYLSASKRPELGVSFFLYLSFILLFSVFSMFMVINPRDVTEHLSKQDAYIEGIKPGEETLHKITDELFKITLIGAIFLTLLAAMPDILNWFYKWFYDQNLPQNMQFGGTSLLIIVGVALECVQRMNTKTHLTSMYNKLF
uniref:Protein translocase subunit SecY n=1 Tax=Candidatus Phytoplasma phoenicium TaxID=198422 RepID=H2E5X1_9MOLU|nr:SecY [Candidatus Phytoplasma phoenicium]